MQKFLNEAIEGNILELTIDINIFSKEIILKAAYQFLDRGYFFFKFNDNGNIILQLTRRNDNAEDLKLIMADFSDELLSVSLREELEKENKVIREKIITSAIDNGLDLNNYATINTESVIEDNQNQIDFDKDIDDILKEIENDPELKIDEDEIAQILKEIEAETEEENEKPMVTASLEGLEKAKEQFKK